MTRSMAREKAVQTNSNIVDEIELVMMADEPEGPWICSLTDCENVSDRTVQWSNGMWSPLCRDCAARYFKGMTVRDDKWARSLN